MNATNPQQKKDETFYDVLKIGRKATVAEIVSAYHAAKNAFSKDSIATYSLFNPEEVQEILGKLEEAYLTLSNLEKRAEYDRRLSNPEEESFMTPVVSLVKRPEEPPVESAPPPVPSPSTSNVSSDSNPSDTAVETKPTEVSGTFLRETREKRGLTVEDVARITKIPSKFLLAIEKGDLKKMPARVYIQGFVKNLASLYKLEPNAAVKAYLAHLDSLTPPTP